MPRESFHRELDQLVEKVVELGREVESCLDTMVGALEKHDAEAASNQLGVDARYKERGTQIIEECMILQARQAPVAQDLRLIHVLQAVTNHLVRTGTLCEHICQGIAETRDAERDPDLAVTLQEMAHGARDLFRRGLDIFESRDIEHSEELEEADDRVDLMYSEGINLAVNPGDKERVGSPEWRDGCPLFAEEGSGFPTESSSLAVAAFTSISWETRLGVATCSARPATPP